MYKNMSKYPILILFCQTISQEHWHQCCSSHWKIKSKTIKEGSLFRRKANRHHSKESWKCFCLLNPFCLYAESCRGPVVGHYWKHIGALWRWALFPSHNRIKTDIISQKFWKHLLITNCMRVKCLSVLFQQEKKIPNPAMEKSATESTSYLLAIYKAFLKLLNRD